MVTAKKEPSLAEMASLLTALLGLCRQPVGIRFCKTAAEYEKSQAVEPKGGLPYCTAVAKATEGACYKLDAAHGRCVAASTALGLLPVTERRLSGVLYADFKVYHDLAVCYQVAKDMVYCTEPNYGVEITPLGLSAVSPDVVLVILPAKAAMRLLQGYAYHFGGLKTIKMAGMCGICQDCTSYPYVKGDMNISLLCSGTRCVARWREDELGVGIPFGQLAKIIDGIHQTVNLMEPDAGKTAMVQRFKDLGLVPPDVTYHHNYFSQSYGTPASLARRAKSRKEAKKKQKEEVK